VNASARNLAKLAAATVGLLGSLILVEAVVTNHNVRIDLTPEKKFTLSEHARQVVSGLERDVHVTAMLQSDRPENAFIEDMLWRMGSVSPRFSYTLVDMNRNPALARRYDVYDYGALIVESGERRRDARFSAGESELVFAILQVGRDRPKVVYFVTGHGERNLYDDHPEKGFSTLRVAIRDDFYDVRLLPLADVAAVPEDADVVVVCGPQAGFSDAELAALDRYLRSGGALLVLLDPDGSPSLAQFVERYGLGLPPLTVVDPEKRMFAGEDVTFKVSPPGDVHPILRGVAAAPVFSVARVVEPGGDPAKGIVARPVLASSSGGRTIPSGDAPKDGGDGTVGAVYVGAEALVPSSGSRPGRIVVYGDSDFTSNFFIQHLGNKDLAVNTINWLAEDLGQIGARPQSKEGGRHQFFMSAQQAREYGLIDEVIVSRARVPVPAGVR